MRISSKKEATILTKLDYDKETAIVTVGEIQAMNLPDDTEIEINSVWCEDTQELTSVECSGFYHEKDNKVHLTPDIISI